MVKEALSNEVLASMTAWQVTGHLVLAGVCLIAVILAGTALVCLCNRPEDLP